MIKPKLSQDLKMTLTSSLAVGAVAGAAGADVVTVLDPDQTVLTTNQVAVSVFSPTLNLTPVGFYGYTLEPNAVNMFFTAGYYGTFGFIQPGFPRWNLQSGILSGRLDLQMQAFSGDGRLDQGAPDG